MMRTVAQIIEGLTLSQDWKRRPHESQIMKDAIEALKKQKEVIDQMYDLLDETCKDVRERYGEDDVCGLCQYDGAYKTDSGDWANECPGFESDECFCMKNEIRELCGKELLPEPEM